MAVEQFPAAQTALEEYQSIEQQMASPEVVTNPDKMRKLGRRHAELGAIVSAYQSYTAVRDDLEAARERIRLLAIVDTLKYLHKGGRLSGAAALAGRQHYGLRAGQLHA